MLSSGGPGLENLHPWALEELADTSEPRAVGGGQIPVPDLQAKKTSPRDIWTGRRHPSRKWPLSAQEGWILGLLCGVQGLRCGGPSFDRIHWE